jgi:hypothetical protein
VRVPVVSASPQWNVAATPHDFLLTPMGPICCSGEGTLETKSPVEYGAELSLGDTCVQCGNFSRFAPQALRPRARTSEHPNRL